MAMKSHRTLPLQSTPQENTKMAYTT